MAAFTSPKTQDDALRRALTLSLPSSPSSSAVAVIRVAQVLSTGSDSLLKVAQGTVRTAWTVARTAGAGADFVNRNVLTPALLTLTPLGMLAPAASSSSKVRFAVNGQPCELLKSHRHHGSKVENQFKRAQAGLKSGNAQCAIRRAPGSQALLSAPSATKAAARQQIGAEDMNFARGCSDWTLNLGLQSSML